MADSSGKSASAKLNFTPEERTLFGRLFRECDPEGSTVVTGEAAVKMFQKSRLSEALLSEIWTLADTENRGFLVQEDFAKAMRLIGHCQANPGTTLRPELALSASPLPKFEGINAPVGPPPAFPPPGIQPQNSGPIRVPPLTTDRIAEYIKLFERSGAQNGLLSGDLARTSFQGSSLGSDVLAAIWNLVDTEQRGALNTTEFIIAMHLLASYKAKTLTALPPAIPPGLYEAASRRPGPAGPSMRSPTTRPNDLGPIPRQTSGPQQARAPQSRVFAPAPASDWAIGPREKASYDELFDKVDQQRLGYISGEQAVPFFSDSGLPSEVLAAIWDLANVRRLDQLNRDEFAVAMYLIRNQRGKSRPDLPAELPANLIPPSLRSVQPQGTGLSFSQAPPPAPEPVAPKSNADDLFGLDALTSSPPAPVREQITGDSSALDRSTNLDPFSTSQGSPSSSQQFSARGNNPSFFKSFAPASSFGQSIAHQNTGTSTGSAPSASRSAMDDLLNDNDPEASKKITQDSADLANMSNQIGMLRGQMQTLQTKKGVAEKDLAANSAQKRDMEIRLQQFRSQYEQEVKLLKELEDRLTRERSEVQQLTQQISMVQTTFQDVQNRQREVGNNLESTQRENAGLKERLREMNEFIARTRPEIEKMQSEQRHQKGLVAIQKKQAEKLEEEKAQLEKQKADLAQAQREDANRPPMSRELTGASAMSNASSTNPFMRRSPQASMDNTMSPSGFQRTLSHDSNKFDNIFHSAFSTPSAAAPPTSFRDAFAPPGSSVKSSEPDMPTPSTSPPLSAYQESPHVPMPPVSRQITSKDLPINEKPQDPESLATSVRVETPNSRYDFSTPTNVGSSPQIGSISGFESAKPSTGSAVFGRDISASSPVASIKSEASKQTGRDAGPFGASSGSGLEPNITGTSALSKDSGKQDASRADPFSFGNQGPSGGKGDFEAAFASVGKSNGASSDPVDKFNTEFPPIKDEFPTTQPKKQEEFPPIAERDFDESDSDAGGFDDDFTRASPRGNAFKKEKGRTTDFGSSFQAFPSAPEPPSSSFDAPPTPSAPKELEKAFGAPSNASQGEALFGAPKGNNSTNQPKASAPTASGPSKSSGPSAFDFDHGFDELDDAKEPDDHDDDDLMGFGPSHGGPEHDFNPVFDSPITGKDRPSTGNAGKLSFPEDHFGDFESSFGPPKDSSKPGTQSSGHDWDAMMKGIDVDNGDSPPEAPMPPPPAPSNASGKAPASKGGVSTKDFNDIGPPFPEAPEPPRLGPAVSAGTEHDDPILKRLVGMGFPRPLALDALEKYDYDLSKAAEYLSHNQAK